MRPWFDIALYDAACCDQGLKDDFMENHGILLRTSLNPRKIATLTCVGGTRHGLQRSAKRNPDVHIPGILRRGGRHPAQGPDSEGGRTATVSSDLLPHNNPQDPRMAKRFKATMARRTSVGRMIKRLKCDLGDSRLPNPAAPARIYLLCSCGIGKSRR